MKFKTAVIAIFVAALVALSVSCSDDKSYAQLLNEENQAVNNFLADQQVVLGIPEDTVFVTGPQAPYYRLDDDGVLYMQVLNAGTPGNRVKDDEQIYFRYTRYAMSAYRNGKLGTPEGNTLTLVACWFRYNNFRIQGSSQWGQGIQYPLALLPVDCEVNLIIKSRMGFTDEQSDVQAYLYHLTYQRPAI